MKVDEALKEVYYFCKKSVKGRIVFKKATLVLVVSLATSGVLAQDMRKEERAMLNASRVADQLKGVLAPFVPHLLTRIVNNELPRIAPEQPIWVMDSVTAKILHYQGKPEYAGQAVSRLADESGVRFGQVAINSALQGNDGWVAMKLGGQNYRAFCKARDPFVVCSLAI